jgi:hypothetical protein
LVLDFLCIHPFRDGNGRVSRLLTVLALYHHGIEVGRYISLERLIEESQEDYYAVLQTSSTGWHEGKHDLVAWLNYFLAIVRRASCNLRNRPGRPVRSRCCNQSGSSTGARRPFLAPMALASTSADRAQAPPDSETGPATIDGA